MMRSGMTKLVITALLLLLAVLSCLYGADWASDPQTHAQTISELDKKSETVLMLSAGSAGASALVSMLPDDTATPVADKLADLSMYFGLVLCIIYTERFLLTILGLTAFRFLIPAALILVCISLFWRRQGLRSLALKLALVGLAVFLVIPASIKVGEMIDRSFDETYREAVSATERFQEETEDSEEEQSGIWNTIKGTYTKYRDKATALLNHYLQSFAVMIVTTCVIPVLVLLFFVWILKQFLGIDMAKRVVVKVGPESGRGDRREEAAKDRMIPSDPSDERQPAVRM